MTTADSQDLAGLRVVLLRTPGRSAGLAGELMRRGGIPLYLPLIDFELPQDPASLDRALDDLAGGGCAWLVVTSATTVAALQARAHSAGSTLAALLPAATRVAAVGEATAEALGAAGVPVALVPAESSGRGLLKALPAGPGRILLPQASLADTTLADGLAGKGWSVERVEAYLTVDYPADPARRLPEPGDTGTGAGSAPAATPALLDAGAFRTLAASDGVDAVVLTSPSTVRRFSAMLEGELEGALPAGVAAVAIGRSTAAEAAVTGLHLQATAAQPTPRAVADAVLSAVSRERPSSTNGVLS
jgi:uroporphyrinogen-III synthase